MPEGEQDTDKKKAKAEPIKPVKVHKKLKSHKMDKQYLQKAIYN
jgi:hypothetical protein